MKNYASPGEVMYHTGLTREMLQGARYALVPGDPGRVEGLAKALDPAAVYVTSHREFTSWLARVAGEAILVMSTGMGGPCITFTVEELARLGITTFIRVGTTGSLQEDIELGDLVISRAAVRLDGAGRAYAPLAYPAAADLDVTLALRKAARELGAPHHVGITVTTDSFWPGQERYDSFGGYVVRQLQGTLKEWQSLGCSNYEMEAATLFTLCSVLGLRAGAVCGVVAKRTAGEAVASSAIYKAAEKRFQAVSRRTIELLLAEETGRGNAGRR